VLVGNVGSIDTLNSCTTAGELPGHVVAVFFPWIKAALIASYLGLKPAVAIRTFSTSC
jgi:hypothetical protein